MNDLLVRYHFTMTIAMYKDGYERASPYILCDEFPMLKHLSSHELKSTQKIVTHLEAVVIGEKQEYLWGSDFCHLVSHKDITTIHHHLTEKGLDVEQDIYTQVSTTLILKIMKDWKLFLQKVPAHLFVGQK